MRVPSGGAKLLAVDRLRHFLSHPAVLLVLALGGAVLFFGPGGHTVERGTKLQGRELTTSEGEMPLFGPGITVLNFWGEHCPPCRSEAPELTRVHAALRGRGRVLGVSVDSADLSSARRVGQGIGIGFPIAVIDRDLQDVFGVTVIPTTYVVDAEGVVRRSFVGAVSRRTLEQAISAIE